MLTIVYVSRAPSPPGPDELESLLRVARDRNAAAGVTGMLVYAEGSFMQQLEGEDGAVDATYARIVDDERHGEIRLLSRRAIDARRFATWSMGFAHPTAASLARELPGYREPTAAPLASPALVYETSMAESLLAHYAGAPDRA